ncbi:MAG: ABC transporter permease [Sulfuricurvum sp.]|jgi:peptide/nickel transport system permease protein
MPRFSVALVVVILFVCFISPLFVSYDPYTLDADLILLPPSFAHPFGTDRLGRDLLSRVVEGGQASIIIGVGSAFVGSFAGLMLGAMAGYFRGVVDRSFVVAVDLFLTFPTFFLLLALASYVNASIFMLIFIISITGWMSTARLVRSESFKLASMPYIKILKMAKVSRVKILLKYFAPLLAPIFFISFTFGVGGAILAESSLSFLGLGIMPPQMSWGSIMSDGKEVIELAWWVSFFPGLMIFLVTYSLINISNYLQQLTNRRDVL